MSGMTLSVDDNLVRPVIEKEIQAAIVRELGKSDQMIAEVVRKVMEMKVDREGKPSTYGSDTPYLEWAFKSAIHDATKKAISKWIEENSPAIEAELQKQFVKQKGEFSKAIVGQLLGAVSNKWQFSVNVKLPE
jgi:uncharacterized protein YajQ (UPF0234 family)